MQTENGNLKLTVSPRGETGVKLVPEEDARFDLKLRNGGSIPVDVPNLDGNDFTPELRVFDAAGKLVLQATPRDLFDRYSILPPAAKSLRDRAPRKTSMVTLAPGEELDSEFNVWSHASPLSKGRYELAVSHRMGPGSAQAIEGNRVAFEVEAASVSEVALGYQKSSRRESVTAWIAAPAGGGPPRVLLRLSTLYRYSATQTSGSRVGEVPAGTRLALSAGSPPKSTSVFSWLAVAGPRVVYLIQQTEGHAYWRSGPVPLPAQDIHPVPGFPDRDDHAVFLATGKDGSGRPVLTGFVVRAVEERPPLKPWSVPLKTQPTVSACIFGGTKEIAVLLVTGGPAAAAISRIDVQEDGTLAAPEAEVRATPNEVLAVFADQRERQRPSFLVLEADRRRPDRLTLVTVPPRGAPQVRELGAVAGWPVMVEKVEQRFPPAEGRPAETRTVEVKRPSRAVRVFLATSWEGAPLLALIDELGRYYGGGLDGGALWRMDRDDGPRIALPHIAAFSRNPVAFAGFTAAGSLAHLSGR